MNDGHGQSAAEMRAAIDSAITGKDVAKSRSLLEQLWRLKPGPGLAGFVNSRFEKIFSNRHRLHRIAVLRSFTLEPVIPTLRAAAAVNGLDLAVHIGDFNAYTQEILVSDSRLYQFAPEIVFLAVQTEDIAPELWRGFADMRADESAGVVTRVVESFRRLVGAFRAQSNAHLIIHTLEQPLAQGNGLLDVQQENGQQQAIIAINQGLRRIAAGHPGVYLLDYDGLIARHGRESWRDERKWLTVRMPIAADHLIHLAHEWLRFIHPLTGKISKALVVDLDDTLWGGVIGEDGINGIVVGPEYPGAAYLALQRAILDLHLRGIILAVCSKNNPGEAYQALADHEGMLLRPKHFAVLSLNWNDKAQNLRAIADQLNIGLDALAFLDDSPTERAWIRDQLPEVTVIDLPKQPLGYAQALRDCPFFERLSISAEDRERGLYYAAQQQRDELRQNAGSLEAFYYSLQMEAEIALASSASIRRVAQLTQKTNQFNLTTRRYSEQQLAALTAEQAYRVYTLRARDRFGDHGIVGVAIVACQTDTWELDTLLLSCRVIGRTMETALLATVVEDAKSAAIQRLAGSFIATPKNAPAREFYPSHGFRCVLDHAGERRWELDLTTAHVRMPPWISRSIMTEEDHR